MDIIKFNNKDYEYSCEFVWEDELYFAYKEIGKTNSFLHLTERQRLRLKTNIN